jgi:hypothetical protein
MAGVVSFRVRIAYTYRKGGRILAVKITVLVSVLVAIAPLGTFRTVVFHCVYLPV